MSPEDRLLALESEVNTIKADVGSIKGQITSINSNYTQVIKDIQTNTVLTDQIKTNTEDLISLLKGGKVFGKVTAWILGLCAAIAGFWVSVKGLR